jgi:hypothetical protein
MEYRIGQMVSWRFNSEKEYGIISKIENLDGCRQIWAHFHRTKEQAIKHRESTSGMEYGWVQETSLTLENGCKYGII